MKNYLKFLSMFAFAAMISLTGCDKDDDDDDDLPPPPPPTGQEDLTLNVSGLPALEDDFVYEGWVLVEDFPVSVGTFTINDNGDPSPAAFNVDDDQLDDASGFMITIEPATGDDGNPSATRVLAGDFDGNSAGLSTDHDNSLGDDFGESTANGTYLLATPTDGEGNNELSGVWWHTDPLIFDEGPSLNLPELPEGWTYEGWAVVDGDPLSTGRFTNPGASDEQNLYSGSGESPEYPGEDFLQFAPSGHTFPLNLSGQTLIISIEPDLQNYDGDGPFALRPLVASIPIDAEAGETYDMNNNDSSMPSGVVTR